MTTHSIHKQSLKTTTAADLTGMVRIDADGCIFVMDPLLVARLEATYWDYSKHYSGKRRGVPVRWEKPTKEQMLTMEASSQTLAGAASEAALDAPVHDSLEVSKTRPPVVNSLCNCR